MSPSRVTFFLPLLKCYLVWSIHPSIHPSVHPSIHPPLIDIHLPSAHACFHCRYWDIPVTKTDIFPALRREGRPGHRAAANKQIRSCLMTISTVRTQEGLPVGAEGVHMRQEALLRKGDLFWNLMTGRNYLCLDWRQEGNSKAQDLQKERAGAPGPERKEGERFQRRRGREVQVAPGPLSLVQIWVFMRRAMRVHGNFFFHFLFWKDDQRRRSCEKSVRSSCVPFIQCPTKIISDITVAVLIDKFNCLWIDISTIHRPCSDFTSFTRTRRCVCVRMHRCAHVHVCVCLCHSIPCVCRHNYQHSPDTQLSHHCKGSNSLALPMGEV